VTSAYGRSYGYDSAGRLTSYEGTSYTAFAAGHPHAVVDVGGATRYTYDANGNMTTRWSTQFNGWQTLTWDHENRLNSVTGAGTDESYLYDGDGQRVRKVGGGVTTAYVNLFYELSGTTVTKYYYFNGQRVAVRQGNNPLYYLYSDHLGSTGFVTHDGGTPLTNQRYYAFGKVRLTGALPTDHWFTGQKYSSGNGLYHYGARYYDPELGRFIQPDTIVSNPGDAQSFDRYAYVNNNPLRYTDPTGHYSPEELMEHLGCENIECVLGQFKPGGDYDGLWGWFTILTQAQDGDQIYAHSIDQALDGRSQLDDELLGTFARVNGKIMIRLASTASSNAATGQRIATQFGPDTLVAEKTGAVYGTLGVFGEYRLTGGRSVYSASYDKSVNCSYDDCVSLALDGLADATSAVAVGCTLAGQPECAIPAGIAGRVLALGGSGYAIYQTATNRATGTDLTVTLTTSAISFFGSPGAGLIAGEVQTLYDYNALKRKPQ